MSDFTFDVKMSLNINERHPSFHKRWIKGARDNYADLVSTIGLLLMMEFIAVLLSNVTDSYRMLAVLTVIIMSATIISAISLSKVNQVRALGYYQSSVFEVIDIHQTVSFNTFGHIDKPTIVIFEDAIGSREVTPDNALYDLLSAMREGDVFQFKTKCLPIYDHSLLNVRLTDMRPSSVIIERKEVD